MRLLLLVATLPALGRGFPEMGRKPTAAATGAVAATGPSAAEEDEIRHQVRWILENPGPENPPGGNPWYDDGSYGPLLLRLAWHSSAHFSPVETPAGGSNGATMRFEPEIGYHDNRGLELARTILLPVLAEHPDISVSDLWILAGYEAVEALGGPRIEMAWGRIDATADQAPEICPPAERLPDWDDSTTTVREKFGRMGFDDRDIVALIGAHTVGKAHPENLGFPFRNWDNSPVRFDSQYFDFVLSKTGLGPPDWRLVVEDDRTRPGEEIRWFEPSSRGGWLMLPTDMMLRHDEGFRPHAEEFFEDEAAFHAAFAAAFKRVTELGFMFRNGSATRHGSFECARALQLRGGGGGGGSGGCPFAGRQR